MKTYRNEECGFEIDLPENWSFHSEGKDKSPSLREHSLIFKCSSNEAFNIQIGPFMPEPSLEQTETYFEQFAYKKGYSSLGLGRFAVGGNENVWARYYLGGGLWSKKYVIVLNGMKYELTATCLVQKSLLEMEKTWDVVAGSFREIKGKNAKSEIFERKTEIPIEFLINAKETSSQVSSKDNIAGMKTYKNDELGFEINVPETWATPTSSTVQPPFDNSIVFGCEAGEAFNFQIGPLFPEPTLDFTERKFREFAQNSQCTNLEFGRITVEGKPHVWARYYMGHGVWTKKYMIVLGGTEYAITATCFDFKSLAIKERVWDEIVASFYLAKFKKQVISGIDSYREKAAGELYAKAYQAVSNEQYSEARNLLEKCLAQNPNHVLAHKELAVIHKKEGDLHGALIHRREVKRLDPSDTINRYNLSFLFAWTGENETALEEAKELLDMEPNNPGFQNLFNKMAVEKVHKSRESQLPATSKSIDSPIEIEKGGDLQKTENTLVFSMISYFLITTFALLYILSKTDIYSLLSLYPTDSSLFSDSEQFGMVMALFFGLGAFFCLVVLFGILANIHILDHSLKFFNLSEATMQVKDRENETFGSLIFSDYTNKPEGILGIASLQIKNLFHALLKIIATYFSVGYLGKVMTLVVAIVVFIPPMILKHQVPFLWQIAISLFWFSSCYRASLLWLVRTKGIVVENGASGNRREITVPSLNASTKDIVTGNVTPQFIQETINNNESIIKIIKDDLMRTNQIGYKEVWQLGLITPDQDKFDPRPDPASLKERVGKSFQDLNYRYRQLEQIPLKRTAVLHSKSYFNYQANNVMIYNGLYQHMGHPGGSYRLSQSLNKGEFINIRNIRIASDALHVENRTLALPGFLREDGLPLKDSYLEGDPLTTERGGTIVIDKGKMIVIYPKYFEQRRLIDDEGNLIEMGLEEEFVLGALTGVKMRPSVSELLFRHVTSNGYIPIVRYRSFPYVSDYMLPILDSPMSASGWADLYIDPKGNGKLFISRDKTTAEWYEMMEKLRQLLFSELAKKDYHLLGLTKDKTHLSYYLAKKMEILKDYFIIQDWRLP